MAVKSATFTVSSCQAVDSVDGDWKPLLDSLTVFVTYTHLFSNHFSPPDDSTRINHTRMIRMMARLLHFLAVIITGDDSSRRWSALTSWESNPGGALAFAEHCIFYGKDFALWDALHRCIAVFDDHMTTAFRIIRPLLTEYFQQPNLPPTIFSAIRTVYLFMVAPRAHRHIVTDYLLEVGRWVAETDPMLVREATPCFVEMLQQEFIPPTETIMGTPTMGGSDRLHVLGATFGETR